MHRLLTTLGRGFKEKIGWKRLGIAASLLIIAFAVTHLVRTLKGVDTGVILTALTEIAPHRIALAALCVVGAFCTLTFYDFFALRTIGKNHVPYRIAALSSFTSYTIGHNIGATVFTGGAIRFRIYSDYGLTAIDVAKICFLSGLTFWLGNLFVLGFGMAWHPWAASAMDLLPPAMNRLIAIGCLAGIAAYFVWLLTGEQPPRTRPERLEGGAALGAADAAAGPDRRGRSRLLRAGDVSVDAAAAAYRFHFAGGGVHPGDAARLRQPCARQHRRVRRRDAGGAAGVRPGTIAGDAGGVPDPVFPDPVRHLDLDHGNARTLAQRGAALAGTPPAERSLHGHGAVRQPVKQPANPEAGNSVVICAVRTSFESALAAFSYFRLTANVKRAMAGILSRSMLSVALLAGALAGAIRVRRREAQTAAGDGAAADFVGGPQPLPAVPRGTRFPAARREPGAAAAFWPPNRRWSCRATAAAGRATR